MSERRNDLPKVTQIIKHKHHQDHLTQSPPTRMTLLMASYIWVTGCTPSILPVSCHRHYSDSQSWLFIFIFLKIETHRTHASPTRHVKTINSLCFCFKWYPTNGQTFSPLNLIMSISWKIFQVLTVKANGWYLVVKHFLSVHKNEWMNEWTGIPLLTSTEKLSSVTTTHGSTVTTGALGRHPATDTDVGGNGWAHGHPGDGNRSPILQPLTSSKESTAAGGG